MRKSKRIILTPSLIRKARKSLGWTQQELADKTGMAKITIAKFEGKDGTARLLPLYNDRVVDILETSGFKIR